MQNSNRLSLQEKEEQLSQYIDSLNAERKPSLDRSWEEEDQDELMALFETVRAVKRTRTADHEGEKGFMKKQRRNGSGLARRLVAMAATVALLLGGALIYQQIQEDPLDPQNIAYGMMEQYRDLDSFQGIIEEEVVDETEGITYTQTIEVMYQSPHYFYAVHHRPGGSTEKLFTGGETLYEVDRDGRLTLRSISEQMLEYELQEYRMDTQIRERMSELMDVQLVAEETVAGRDTQVYRFTYEDSASEHRIWVDKATGIALRQWYDSGRGLTIDSRFISFQEDVEVVFPDLAPGPDETFEDERITDEERRAEEQRSQTLESLSEGDRVNVIFMGMADSNFAEFQLGDQFVVFGIDQSLQDWFMSLDMETELKVEIGFEDWTTNPIVKKVLS